ncbi:MAG: hypothetical protein AAGA96_09790 [Verrucomicrobiota bacterium]
MSTPRIPSTSSAAYQPSRPAHKHDSYQPTKPWAPMEKAAVGLTVVFTILALIPILGWLAAPIGVVFAFIIFILAIVTFVKGGVMAGLAMLFVTFIYIPAIALFGPMLLAGVLNDAIETTEQTAPTAAAAIADSPAQPPEEVVSSEPLVPVRKWTNKEGETIHAELLDVVKDSEGYYVGLFRDSATGEQQEIPIGRLSDSDIAEVRAAMSKEGLMGK